MSDRASKVIETSLKSLIILAIPTPTAVIVGIVWYYTLYARGLYFGDNMREILTNALIPILGLLYSLLTSVIINHVFDEYKAMRLAVKERDIETFMKLKDEELSPLLHGMVAVLALSVLAGFMGLKYPTAEAGLFIICGTTYIFSLLCLVVIQLDEPCYGFWVIKSIPLEWLNTDAKRWRAEHYTHERPLSHDGSLAPSTPQPPRQKRRKRS